MTSVPTSVCPLPARVLAHSMACALALLALPAHAQQPAAEQTQPVASQQPVAAQQSAAAQPGSTAGAATTQPPVVAQPGPPDGIDTLSGATATVGYDEYSDAVPLEAYDDFVYGDDTDPYALDPGPEFAQSQPAATTAAQSVAPAAAQSTSAQPSLSEIASTFASPVSPSSPGSAPASAGNAAPSNASGGMSAEDLSRMLSNTMGGPIVFEEVDN